MRLTPDARFERFHRVNPNVYAMFRRLAREIKSRGHRRYSADAILHQMRWLFDMEPTDEGEHPKINNDYAACLARLLMREEPDFAGFFKLRKTRTDRDLERAHADGRLFH